MFQEPCCAFQIINSQSKHIVGVLLISCESVHSPLSFHTAHSSADMTVSARQCLSVKKKNLKSTWNIHISYEYTCKIDCNLLSPCNVLSDSEDMMYSMCCLSVHQWKGEFYLAQVLVQPLICSSEQRSDREAVCLLLIYNLRLLQQWVELLPDLGLDHVLCGSIRLSREETKEQWKQKYCSVLVKQAMSSF